LAIYRSGASKGSLAGRITLDDEWWYMGSAGKEPVASGREPADTDQAAFQGIHALNPLLVIDEARHDDQTDVMMEFTDRVRHRV
jgi:hypothetical protein